MTRLDEQHLATPPLEPGEPEYGHPGFTLLWWDPADWGLSEWDDADAGAFEDSTEDGAEE